MITKFNKLITELEQRRDKLNKHARGMAVGGDMEFYDGMADGYTEVIDKLREFTETELKNRGAEQ